MKVCQACGDTYKDSIDFCFNDGQVLMAMSAAFAEPITEIPTGSFDDDGAPEEPTESVSDPGLVDIDDLGIDEEPTQRTEPYEHDEDERTVPRAEPDADGIGADPGERTAPTDSDTDPVVDDRPAPVATAPLTRPTPEPPPLEAPVGYDDDERSDDEDTPVLQEPVLAVVPPTEHDEYETASTVIPGDSLGEPDLPERGASATEQGDDEPRGITDFEDGLAPFGGGPTLSPAPPPVPNSLGATLPLHESASPPAAERAEGRAPADVATRPLTPRPSSTPTLPSIQLRPGGDEASGSDDSGTRAFVLGISAFVLSAGIVGMLLVGALLWGWLGGGSDPDDGGEDERRATLPHMAPNEPLPPPEYDLPPDDELDDGDDPVGTLPSVAPSPATDATAERRRDPPSISVVESLQGTQAGTGERPIVFESIPPNALVSLDGHEPFRTPHEVRLTIGETYGYTMTFPGYDPVESDFLVMRGSGILRRTERLVRTPTMPTREGPIIFGPQGCRLRVDGVLMESKDIVGGSKIDETTGRPMVYLPFQLGADVLGVDEAPHSFQVVSGVGTPPDCAQYSKTTIEYKGQKSIVLK